MQARGTGEVVGKTLATVGSLRATTSSVPLPDSSFWILAMKFIELSGKTLQQIVSDDELHPNELLRLGVTDGSVVRVNLQGDIELRRADRWEIIGGLLGEYEERIKRETGLDWL